MSHEADIRHLPEFMTKMARENLPAAVIDTFSHYYQKIITGETGLLSDKHIRPVAPDELADHSELGPCAEAGRLSMPHAVRIVLNGGLGTSMGLKKAKSLLKAKREKTFLELILEQTDRDGVKLALMNSFSTHGETCAALKDLKPLDWPAMFLQHKFPKILQRTLEPAEFPEKPDMEWNPPGHGDIYTALYTSGLLQRLLDEGFRYAFISNSDNLGATMDEALLGYFATRQFPFMMEVAERTPEDVKGGHLAKLADGRLILREAAQCPEYERESFRNIDYYRYFNTNNIWINLVFLQNLIHRHGAVRLPMILNPKTLDPRDDDSPAVFQVESAMGAAISLFKGAAAVRVPRSRFFPVKKSNDLLAVRSDYFVLSPENRLVMNPARLAESIRINLDPRFYRKIDRFDERFVGVPSLVSCEHLDIRGDIRFDKNVTIRGRVTIKNNRSQQAIIRSGAVIDRNLNF